MDKGESIFDWDDIFDNIPISKVEDFKLIDVANLTKEQKKDIIILLDASLSEQHEGEYKIWDIDPYLYHIDTFYSAANEFKESPFYLAIEWRINDLHQLIEDL